MKRKTLTLVLCLLTVMSLVGVGFASWVISADTSVEEEGKIVVDTVTDNRLTLEVGAVGNKDIIFTAPSGSTSGWLTYDGSKGAEQLKVTFPCTLTKNDGTAFKVNTDGNTHTITDALYAVTFTEPDKGTGSALTNYGIAEKAEIFDLYNTTGWKIEEVQLSSDNKTLTFNLVVGYAWGSLFGFKNPFTYYNALTVNELCGAVEGTSLTDKSNWGDHADYYLSLLAKIEATVKYNITLTVSKTTGTAFTY